ncbi:MAG: hypothetical protein ACKVTZ_20500 [Bacteroidia bacterium]
MNPYIAIIRDGHSDFLVLKHFVSAIFEHHHLIELTENDFLEFEHLNITNALSKYISKAGKENYALFSAPAKELRSELNTVLFTAYKKFSNEKGKTLCNQDVLILNADAEKVLGVKQNYFTDWAYAMNNTLWLAVEEFYHKMVENGYDYQQLPLILPLILFPSSEILVAACMHDFNKEDFRSFEAKPTLKQKVYGTDNIPNALESSILQETLALYVVPESLSSIYRELPEVRKFMQILAFATFKTL